MKRNKIILVLVGIISLIVIIRLVYGQQTSHGGVKVIRIEPARNSLIYASSGSLDISIYFDKDVRKMINGFTLKENVGLMWVKEIRGENVVSFRTSFGKEIMSWENLLLQLYLGDELIDSWNYQIPIDEKISGPIVEAKIEKEASFIPSEEDIAYFAEQNEIINQEQPLWRLLPYETTGYKISHYIEPLKLVIYVKEGISKEVVGKQVREWIKTSGGNEKDHKLEFRNLE